MALENVKKMQESTEQYKSFVDTELECLDSYVAALNASESKHIITRKIHQCSLFVVPKKMQDVNKELEQLLASGKITHMWEISIKRLQKTNTSKRRRMRIC